MPGERVPCLNGFHVAMSHPEITTHLWTVISSLRRIADTVEVARAEKLHQMLPGQVNELGETLSLLQEVTEAAAHLPRREVIDMDPEVTRDEPQEITPMRSDEHPTAEELESDD